MGDMRDRNALLSQDEIEAIKVCQGIINRMAENSAKAKNLFFTISAAFVVLLGSSAFEADERTLGGYAVISIALWYMDARYLQLEQMFRGVHRRIINGCLPYLDAWMFKPTKEDAASIWKLMLWNFSTMVYPAVAAALIAIALLASA